MPINPLTRRGVILGASALMAASAVPGRAEVSTEDYRASGGQAPVSRNVSAFATHDWRDHFDAPGLGMIVADTGSRSLHRWDENGEGYRVFPTSVPVSEELTRRGYTEIVRKRVGPDWTPTPSMVARNPELRYMPPGPGNPLGTHAMYLDWPAYLIHGTHDSRKIGRPSSDGCIGLYNAMIEELFAMTPVGTQVRLI